MADHRFRNVNGPVRGQSIHIFLLADFSVGQLAPRAGSSMTLCVHRVSVCMHAPAVCDGIVRAIVNH